MDFLNKDKVETLLISLDEKGYLFPQFTLSKDNNELKQLGSGGFSVVYEMYNKERSEHTFAVKIIGLQKHRMTSEEFWNTSRIQWILCQESRYIMRILEARELVVELDENCDILLVENTPEDAENLGENAICLQFVLMEKLEKVIAKDRFGKASLTRCILAEESEVCKLALEIGQALLLAHSNNFLHRDIKLENIFYDPIEGIYKLGDFGVAKWSEKGNAETAIYTDGYGAPEIEVGIYDYYNATADIYSLGVTLYLLLNDLKFPGSAGYYPLSKIQYSPEYIFPAPQHASVEIVRMIHRMCSYYPEDRYQSMEEVIDALASFLTNSESTVPNDLMELADIATETYRDKETKQKEVSKVSPFKTKSILRARQQVADDYYILASRLYFLTLTALLTLLYKGFESGLPPHIDWLFILLPMAVVTESVLKKMKELHLLWGCAVIIAIIASISSVGITVPHIAMLLSIILEPPLITLASGLSAYIWIIMEYTNKWEINYFSRFGVKWIILTLLIFVIYRYILLRIGYINYDSSAEDITTIDE